MSGIAVRELTADDAAWAAELMEQRRQVYARYSPVFWRPAQGVTGLHERFLRRQIASPANVALRRGLQPSPANLIRSRRPPIPLPTRGYSVLSTCDLNLVALSNHTHTRRRLYL